VPGKARVLTVPTDIEMPDWQREFRVGEDQDRKTLSVKMYVLRVFRATMREMNAE